MDICVYIVCVCGEWFDFVILVQMMSHERKTIPI